MDRDTIRGWYWTSGSITLVLAIIYMTLHLSVIKGGNEIIKLSKQEATDINLILFGTSGTDTVKVDSPLTDDQRKELVYNYIFSVRKPDPDFEKKMRKDFRQFSLQQFSSVISNYPIKTVSYFWLTEPYVFLEIIFWAWFGLMASLFYSVSEAYRSGEFNPKEISVHISKFFYAPLSAIIIFLSVAILSTSGDLEVVEFSHGTIVLSFILGFFSGRAIDLLTRIKDIILPLGKNEPSTSIETSGSFEELSREDKYALMKAAVDANFEEWKKIPNFSGVQIGKKKKEKTNIATDIDAIIFQVTKKSALLLPSNKFPKQISWQGYNIPTDVVVASETVAHYIAPTGSKEIAPGRMCPGAGVSRLNTKVFGTIGLRVKRVIPGAPDQFYLLSCYHVLFSHELNNNVFIGHTTNSTTNEEVVTPSQSNSKIGFVREGELSGDMDAAIAELVSPTSITSAIHSLAGPTQPPVIYPVTEEDVQHPLQVNIYGRYSGKQKGKIVGLAAIQRIRYTNKTSLEIHGLIAVEKISSGGDSGCVAVNNNGDVVGMVIAGDDKFSYIIPIQLILDRLNIQIA